MTAQPGPEWYQALSDTPSEAQAQFAMDKAKHGGGASLPFADGAAFDSRMNGRHN